MPQTPTLNDYVLVLRRGSYLILVTALLAPLLALVFSLSQTRSYRASAEVLLTRQNLAASLNGISDTSQNGQPERLPSTQADLAAAPAVAAQVLRAVHVRGETPTQFLARSSVVPKTDADLLVFSVIDRSPQRAIRLATEYARQFTIYRKQLDTAALERARAGLEVELMALRRTPNPNPTLYANLVSKDQEIRAMEALQTGNTFLARPADGAHRVRPRPIRNSMLGLALGLFLGVLLAFIRNALDTRARSVEELARQLKLPELGRLPNIRRRDRRGRPGIAMMSLPNGAEAEAFRVLRARVELANLERDVRAMMITSPRAGDGKSTTAANLAVAFARTGKRVVLVDLDLHRPVMHRLFGLAVGPGLTDVAVGHADLSRALVPIALVDRGEDAAGALPAQVKGVLEVLPAGPLPPVPAEFIETHAVAQILDELRARADLVIVDAPGLLGASDAVTLSARVDALIVVMRVNAVPGRTVKNVARLLEGSHAPALGFIAVAVDADEADQYGQYAAADKDPPSNGKGSALGAIPLGEWASVREMTPKRKP